MADKKISFRVVLDRQVRAMKLWQKAAPQLLPSVALSQLFASVTPLAAVYLSGRILNALISGAAAREVWMLVAIALAVTAGVAAMSAALTHWKQGQWEGAYWLSRKLLAGKRASMDFPDADSQRVEDLEAQILENSNMASWGLLRVIHDFQSFCSAAFSILLGGAMSVGLFLHSTTHTGFAALNSPLLMVLMAATMVAADLLSAKLEGNAETAWIGYAEKGRLGNRMFSAYGFFGEDRKRALDIRIYRQEKISSHYCSQHNFTDKSEISLYLQGKGGLLLIGAQAVEAVVVGAIYLFVCLKAWAGAFPIGSATQYIGAVTQVFTGVGTMLVTLSAIRANAAGFLPYTYEYLDIPNAMYQGSLTTEKRADRKYEVEFRDVSFRYPGAQEYALRHVNMKFQVGRRLAVVGMNGSGKTTFIKLLCRLYDPTEGQILLNGIDIRKYRYQEYMDIFSIVFQDFQLFAMPLGENVATKTDYDRARATQCLRQAGFGERLETMGLDTHLYKTLDKQGVEVSGGEAQKIAIARALYKDAPFIILDEPTAALDPIAEAEIYEKFDEIAGDKTAIYISHRLSSCKFCDEIAVFDAGQVIQQGTHQQLLADTAGKYHELWNAQAQYYTKEA